MVRERQTSGRAPHRKTRAKQPAGSIWETPHLKQILSEPVGTPMELTREEAMAILEEHLRNPGPYNKEKAERDLRELRKIRRMWGSMARDA